MSDTDRMAREFTKSITRLFNERSDIAAQGVAERLKECMETAIAAAVRTERERCAKVARGFKTGDGNAIAAAIEGGDDEAEPRNPGK